MWPPEMPLHSHIVQPPSCFACALQVPLLVDLQWVTPLLAKLGGWAGIVQLAQAKAQALDPAGRSSVLLSMAFQAGEEVRSLREVTKSNRVSFSGITWSMELQGGYMQVAACAGSISEASGSVRVKMQGLSPANEGTP